MKNFKVGDYVQSEHFSIGQIVEIYDGWCDVEFETGGGGGCLSYDFDELTPVDINEYHAEELLRDWKLLVYKAKEYGMDIRFAPDSTETLELYYHEDYPDLILVDKSTIKEE